MISTSNNSNWLDRLRSSRGFPTGIEPNLDHFLSSSSSANSNHIHNDSSSNHSESTQSTRSHPTHHDPPPPPPPRQLSGVLSDLFNMGGCLESSSRTFSLKSSRKQPNPRAFRVSLPGTELTTIQYGRTEVGFDDDEGVDLKEYTKSEVTVIDTSFDVWKCDKWVFRKNNDWKIKDKKSCKSNKNGVKKKKVLVDNNNSVWSHRDGNNKVKKKKRKREVENLLMNHQNKEPSQDDKDTDGKPIKKREDFLSKVPRKRFPCPRPPEKVRKERSSVVLIKCIPPSNVKTAVKPGKTFHKKCAKQMKIP